MRITILILALLLPPAFAATLPMASPASVALSPERLDRITQTLQAEVDQGSMPGAVLLVARHGKIAYLSKVGKLAPGVDAAMPADALFRIYSMTKPITSVAVMSLVEDGKLSLDDPVSRYLPQFAHLAPITIQDLLRHTAGLSYGFLNRSPSQQAYARAGLWNDRWNNAEFVDQLAQLPLSHTPGDTWEYSHATDVLGRVIEVVSGQSLSAFLRARVLDPLGMQDTGFEAIGPDKQVRLAEGFERDRQFGQGQGIVRFYDPRQPRRWESGGAGLMSTALDYARFLQMLLNGGSLDGQRVLGPHTVSLMTADQLDARLNVFAGYGWNLAAAVRRTEGMASFPGSVGDYFWFGAGGASFWVDPKQDMFVIFMAYQPSKMDEHHTLLRQMVYASITK